MIRPFLFDNGNTIVTVIQCISELQIKGTYITLSIMTNLDSSKLKESADDNFRCDENSKKFFKRVENKREIAHYEQFLVFPQCFQKTCTVYT